MSRDPLDIMSDDEDEVASVGGRVENIKISSPPPQPIDSPTLTMFRQQVAGDIPVQPQEEAAASGDDQSKAKGTRENYDILATHDR